MWEVGENRKYAFFISGKEVGQQNNLLVERVEKEGELFYRFQHVFQLDTRSIQGQDVIDLQSELVVDEKGHPQIYHADIKANVE